MYNVSATRIIRATLKLIRRGGKFKSKNILFLRGLSTKIKQ